MESIIVGRDREDLQKYGDKGTAFIGKHIVGKGEDAHLTNRIMMDVTRPHVLLVCGKRGSGKSYSAGIVAEEIATLPEEIRENLSVIMFDTMGIYWSMKNANERDKDALKDWGLEPKGLEVKLFVPKGYADDYEKAGVTYDSTFNLVCSDLEAEEWVLTFGFSFVDEYGTTIERVIKQLKKAKGGAYSIADIITPSSTGSWRRTAGACSARKAPGWQT